MYFIASHLCDTRGCVRIEHLTTENQKENLSRIWCPGVILTLKGKHIVEVTPCKHGIKNKKANDDFLKFTCRKITVMVQDRAATDYYRNLS